MDFSPTFFLSLPPPFFLPCLLPSCLSSLLLSFITSYLIVPSYLQWARCWAKNSDSRDDQSSYVPAVRERADVKRSYGITIGITAMKKIQLL